MNYGYCPNVAARKLHARIRNILQNDSPVAVRALERAHTSLQYPSVNGASNLMCHISKWLMRPWFWDPPGFLSRSCFFSSGRTFTEKKSVCVQLCTYTQHQTSLSLLHFRHIYSTVHSDLETPFTEFLNIIYNHSIVSGSVSVSLQSNVISEQSHFFLCKSHHRTFESGLSWMYCSADTDLLYLRKRKKHCLP